MLASKCRLWIAMLWMFCAAHSVLAGEDMSMTAPTRIKPESRVTISWSGGKATYTVRILVNSHESSESKSIADTWYTWTAHGVKDGDQVQFFVYDSSGVSTKSPHIPVRVKGESNDTSSKNDGSKTKQQVTSETAGTYSESIKATSEDGGNEAKSTMTTTTSTTTGTRSGRIPTAPPQSSYAPDSTTTPLSESGTSSSSRSIVPTSDAPPAPETMAAPTTTSPAASATAEPATPSSIGTTAAASSPDRTNLYLGLIGILIALVLLLVLVWWWRKQTGSSSARADGDDDDDDSRRSRGQDGREQYYQSLPKKKTLAHQRRARTRNAQGLNVASERALLRCRSEEEGQSSDERSETDDHHRRAERSTSFVPAVPLLGRTRSSDPG